MEISAHYSAYPQKTLIAVTNNHLARLLCANDRLIEEIESIEIGSDDDVNERQNDAEQQQDRENLYERLNKRLLKLAPDYERILICMPEALKGDILASLDASLEEKMSEVIPKNLASLELDAIVRILDESHT